VGLNLIVAMAAFKENFWTVCRAAVPFVILMFLWLVSVIVFPELSLYFVR
jgi:C4-dicarboxylate transporter, DctM subunit